MKYTMKYTVPSGTTKVKLNFKCPRYTVDDSNSCNPHSDDPVTITDLDRNLVQYVRNASPVTTN